MPWPSWPKLFLHTSAVCWLFGCHRCLLDINSFACSKSLEGEVAPSSSCLVRPTKIFSLDSAAKFALDLHLSSLLHTSATSQAFEHFGCLFSSQTFRSTQPRLHSLLVLQHLPVKSEVDFLGPAQTMASLLL